MTHAGREVPDTSSPPVAPDVPGVSIELATSPDDRAACIALRFRVFVDEQRVPPEEEVDAHDAGVPFLLARAGNAVVGTARVVFVEEGRTAKVGRVAVERERRGVGIGLRLVAEATALAARAGAREAVLDAQVPALGFYERLGFRAEGPEFLDAGIPHRRMRLALGPAPGTSSP